MKKSKSSGRGGRWLLLASTSVAALMVGGGAPAALACYTGPFTGGYTNAGATACIVVNNSSFSGTLGNTGTISPGGPTGIAVVNGSTISGQISDSGIISASGYGILIDRSSAINSGSAAILISGPTFIGGLSNAGAISAVVYGIFVDGGTTFGGGISNAGTISAVDDGIEIVNTTTFAGGINNAGTISGNVVGIFLNGGSTFVGGITNSGMISAGTYGIFVDGGATFGGGISNAGTISAIDDGIEVSGTATFAGGINNAGTISGNVVGIDLSGVATFTGGIANSGTISAGVYGIFVDGSATFGGGISNAGKISAVDDGIEVAGIATFAGGINNAGTISGNVVGIYLNGVSTFIGGIANSGTISSKSGTGVSLGNVSTFFGNLSNSGTIIGHTGIGIGSGVTFAGGAIVNTGTITGTGGIAINASAATSPVTLDIEGGAISGNIVGNGTGNGDTVNFALGSGSFAYANTIAAVQSVNIVSGTLFDSGSIDAAGVTVESGGTLAPGLPNTTGTLTINTNLAFNAGSGYEIQLTPSTHAFTTVSGTVTIGGGAVELAPVGTLGAHYSATTFAILTSTGTLSGTFNPNVGYAGTLQLTSTPTLSYDAHDTYLSYGNTIADLATPAGANQNERNVINGIDNAILAGATVPNGFNQLSGLSTAAYLNALTKLDGEDATGAQIGAFTLMTEFLELMLGDNGGGNGGGGLSFAPDQQTELPPDIALAYDAILKAPPKQTFDQRWSVWGSGFGGTGITDGNAAVGSNTVTTTTYGSAAGMEYRPDPNTRLGFALAGAGLNWGLAQGLGTGRADTFQAGVYGKTYLGPAYLSGALAFGNNWFTTNRTAAFGDQLTATFTGQSYAARGEAGYRYALQIPSLPSPASGGGLGRGLIGVTPYGALQTQWFHTSAYSETDLSGGGFGLSYDANTATDTRSELGARFDNFTSWNDKPLMLRASLAWAHDWVSGTGLNAAFEALPGSNFTVNGAAVPPNSALTSASAQYFFTPALSFTAKFDGEFAPTSQTYAGTGTLRYTW